MAKQAEMIKNLGEIGMEVLLEILNKDRIDDKIPKERRVALIILENI